MSKLFHMKLDAIFYEWFVFLPQQVQHLLILSLLFCTKTLIFVNFYEFS